MFKDQCTDLSSLIITAAFSYTNVGKGMDFQSSKYVCVCVCVTISLLYNVSNLRQEQIKELEKIQKIK